MNQQVMPCKSSRILFVKILFVFALVAFAAILVSCKPSNAPVSSPLSTPALSSTKIAVRQTLAAKATDLVRIDQTQAAADLIPRTKVFGPTYIPVTPQSVPTAFSPLVGQYITPVGAGAIVPWMPLLNKGRYHVMSNWVENLDNGKRRLFVYTGELAGPGGEETPQGVIVVQVWQISVKDNLATTDLIGQAEYQTPVQAGSVRIVDARSERLVLQSTNGTVFYFDVPSRQFVPSLVWTPTPSPISPIATPTLPPTTASP